MQNVLLVVLALLLVALNGFFVAAEFGIVTLRKTRVRAIAKSGGLRGRILYKVHSQLDAYLSACQLGITLASLGLGWAGEPAFAGLLEPVFALLGVTSAKMIHGVSFVIAFGVISFLHIVVGELAPKSLAIRMPEAVGLWSALPLYGFYWAMYPAIWLLNASANLVLRVAGLSGVGGHETHYSNDELKLILRTNTGTPGERFTHDERHILAQSLEFAQHTVADLMRPINEVSALYASRSLEQNLDTMRRNRFSRYPYFDEDGEEVLGVIHLKDLFFAEQSGKDVDDLTEHLRPVELISARTPAIELFRRFRTGAPHFALIGEKGKRPVGFITLDNLLGAIVGEIRDEFRLNENDWIRRPTAPSSARPACRSSRSSACSASTSTTRPWAWTKSNRWAAC
jgi:CBS domain containing-hemolysin-like protein